MPFSTLHFFEDDPDVRSAWTRGTDTIIVKDYGSSPDGWVSRGFNDESDCRYAVLHWWSKYQLEPDEDPHGYVAGEQVHYYTVEEMQDQFADLVNAAGEVDPDVDPFELLILL